MPDLNATGGAVVTVDSDTTDRTPLVVIDATNSTEVTWKGTSSDGLGSVAPTAQYSTLDDAVAAIASIMSIDPTLAVGAAAALAATPAVLVHRRGGRARGTVRIEVRR